MSLCSPYLVWEQEGGTPGCPGGSAGSEHPGAHEGQAPAPTCRFLLPHPLKVPTPLCLLPDQWFVLIPLADWGSGEQNGGEARGFSVTWGAWAPTPEEAATSNTPFALRALPALLSPPCTPVSPPFYAGLSLCLLSVLSVALPALCPPQFIYLLLLWISAWNPFLGEATPDTFTQ